MRWTHVVEADEIFQGLRVVGFSQRRPISQTKARWRGPMEGEGEVRSHDVTHTHTRARTRNDARSARDLTPETSRSSLAIENVCLRLSTFLKACYGVGARLPFLHEAAGQSSRDTIYLPSLKGSNQPLTSNRPRGSLLSSLKARTSMHTLYFPATPKRKNVTNLSWQYLLALPQSRM